MKTDVHQHDIRTFPFGNVDRLIGGNGHGNHDVAQLVQQPLCVERNEKLILNDQDAKRPRLHVGLIAMLFGSITTLGGGRGQP